MNFPRQVYLNGAFVAADEARVSAFDRGFIFGDGVYEVIPVYGGRPFRLRPHLERLAASLAAVAIRDPLGPDQWAQVFARLTAGEGGGDQAIYLQITRGAAPRDHAFPAGVTPTVFAYTQPLKYPEPELRRTGVAAVTLPDIRWSRCDIKAVALLANVLLRQQATERGAYEAVLVRDGLVTEGAASNIFIVSGGRLRTPARGPFILPGVTRDLVLDLARAHGIGCEEGPVRADELAAAEEVWMTSSTKEILPITRLDGRPVADGAPGALYPRLSALHAEYKEAFRAGRAE